MRSASLEDDPLVALGARADVRVVFFAVAPDERFERVAFFAAAPDDLFERVAFFAVEPALRLARSVPLDAAATLVCPLVEREERDDAVDVLPALPRAVVAALREPPLRVLALLLVAFRFAGLRALFVVATKSPFPGLVNGYPVTGGR